ncbi:MAG TPA: DUF11 domain-containing protein, partial [Longimicrobiales bacterium]
MNAFGKYVFATFVAGAAALLGACTETPTTPRPGAPSFHVLPADGPQLELLVLCKAGPTGDYTFTATADAPVLWNHDNTYDLQTAQYTISVTDTSLIAVDGQTVQGACYVYQGAQFSGTVHDHIARNGGGVPATVTIVETVADGTTFQKAVTYQLTGTSIATSTSNVNTASGVIGGTDPADKGANIVFFNTPATPDLTIVKTADADTVPLGSNIGFTITVANTGLGTAKDVTLDDTLPVGTGIAWSVSPAVAGCQVISGVLTCDFGDLAAGASASVHVTSPTTFQSCGDYPNSAVAHATNNADVTASATTSVKCPEETPCPSGSFMYSFISGSGDLYIKYDQFPAPNDNSYGINAVGWQRDHKFGDLVGSDHAGFQLTDPTGTIKLQFNVDYLTA